ncbi:hypothetical protein K488DRAFT_76982 [Vararia minispora EC-137]|uniref:Uncharacterized protein n=1 Tax=Vararia minispora EC-137 TaxID=1314806 RepID=A0ACB8QTA7_9AGAM|nr:hypothetical protein K488DRAFT_76982 [Vararia minispora EC-137]
MSGSIATASSDAALFDMGGTLIDSIAAVEAAWGKVTSDIGVDLKIAVAATYGRRACSDLASLRPNTRASKILSTVQEFQELIFFFADVHRPRAMLMPGVQRPRRAASISILQCSSFSVRFTFVTANGDGDEDIPLLDHEQTKVSFVNMEAWQIKAYEVVHSVRILPGVCRMLYSIPGNRCAIAMLGGKTYGKQFASIRHVRSHMYMSISRMPDASASFLPPSRSPLTTRISRPQDWQAESGLIPRSGCLGYNVRRYVVLEDSPVGVHAGPAVGAIVIAVCASHSHEQISTCGAHFVVGDMKRVLCVVEKDGSECLEFTIEVQEGEQELLSL